MIKRPKVCFVPVTMELFWQLYPELKAQTYQLIENVKKRLQQRFDIIEMPLVGNKEQASTLADKVRNLKFDLLVIWENGYVASAIPDQIIEKLNGLPFAILVTQRDKKAPLDMTYARYMDSTATTSAMELGGDLARKSVRYKAFFGNIDDESLYARLDAFASACMVYSMLKQLSIGRIGYSYPGMIDICVDDAGVKKLGPNVECITLAEVQEQLDKVEKKDISDFLAMVKKECDTTRSKEEDLVKSAKTYLALKQILLEKRITALTVHDYDCLSQVTKTVSEFALSYLENKQEISVGVEGDLPNTISAYIARAFTGTSPMFVDWTMFCQDDNTIFFQHNGKADPGIVNNPTTVPSAEPFGGVEGEGVVFEASGKSGDVTMISMVYRDDGWYMFASEGTAVFEPARPCHLNQVTVKVQKPVREFLETACEMGVGHHLNIAYGHCLAKIKYLAELANIKLLSI